MITSARLNAFSARASLSGAVDELAHDGWQRASRAHAGANSESSSTIPDKGRERRQRVSFFRAELVGAEVQLVGACVVRNNPEFGDQPAASAAARRLHDTAPRNRPAGRTGRPSTVHGSTSPASHRRLDQLGHHAQLLAGAEQRAITSRSTSLRRPVLEDPARRRRGARDGRRPESTTDWPSEVEMASGRLKAEKVGSGSGERPEQQTVTASAHARRTALLLRVDPVTARSSSAGRFRGCAAHSDVFESARRITRSTAATTGEPVERRKLLVRASSCNTSTIDRRRTPGGREHLESIAAAKEIAPCVHGLADGPSRAPCSAASRRLRRRASRLSSC